MLFLQAKHIGDIKEKWPRTPFVYIALINIYISEEYFLSEGNYFELLNKERRQPKY